MTLDSIHLENTNVLALVENPLVDGVGCRKVDDLAQDNAIVHLRVNVRTVFLKVKSQR